MGDCFFRRPKGTRRQAPAPLRFGATRYACDHLRAAALRLWDWPLANGSGNRSEARLMPRLDRATPLFDL